LSLKVHLLCFVILLLVTEIYAAKPTFRQQPASTSSIQYESNHFTSWFRNNGQLNDYTVRDSAGFTWQKNPGIPLIFTSGIWIGGYVNDDLHSAMTEYGSEFQPGKIIDGAPDNPALPRYRVYRIQRGDTTSQDYLQWPAQDGAPVDEQGHPLLLGDQTLWFVANDANPDLHEEVFPNPPHPDPLNLEIQYTIFGVHSFSPLNDEYFVKALLIYKRVDSVSSVYVGLWNDPDIGDDTDDQPGCDTTWQLGYAYNLDSNDFYYGDAIPATGIQLLQGPIVPSPGDTAIMMGAQRLDYRNLPLTSFWGYTPGWDPMSSSVAYVYMTGRDGNGQMGVNPVTGDTTTFFYSGDPVSGTGWIAPPLSYDIRTIMGIGPFVLAPGDTQEVVFAVMAGASSDQLHGISTLRSMARINKELYHHNFQDLSLPLAIQHTPPSAPILDVEYTIQARYHTDQGVIADPATFRLWYRFDSTAVFQSLEMNHITGDNYAATLTIPSPREYLYYYLEGSTTGGFEIREPLDAPQVYHKVFVGEDHTSPVIRSATMDSVSSIQFSGEEHFEGTHFVSDNFPIDTVYMEVSENGNEWVPSSLDSIDKTTEYISGSTKFLTKIIWYATVLWQDKTYGDQIRFRLAYIDSSSYGNISYSTPGVITIGHVLNLAGNYISGENPDPDFGDWTFDGWTLSLNGNAAFCDTAFFQYGPNLNTILRYNHLIDLTDRNKVLLFYTNMKRIDAGDSAFIEISANGTDWSMFQYYTDMDNLNSERDETLDFPESVFSTPFYLRFRFKSDGTPQGFYFGGWNISAVRLFVDSTTVGIKGGKTVPEKFMLSQNYPNPFNPRTTIEYSLPKKSSVKITVFNLTGQEVKTLVNKHQMPGNYSVQWSGVNQYGVQVSSGIYFYRIETPTFLSIRKMMYLK